MILDKEHCPEIITPIQAIRAALKALESAVLEKHLQTFVKDAWSSKDKKESQTKLNELLELFKRN